jgi:cytochrome P450
MIAGTDTTSGLLQIMMYFLGENPHVWTKLREAINEVIKSDADITYDNLKKLQYIEWVQYESLRLGGPTLGILLRKATKDHILKDIPITKGTGIIINGLPNQCSEEYFKEPYQFRPERWNEECKNLPAFAMFGFSGGPRTCIGKNLALIESKIAIVKMVRRYKEIRLPEGKRLMKRTFMY